MQEFEIERKNTTGAPGSSNDDKQYVKPAKQEKIARLAREIPFVRSEPSTPVDPRGLLTRMD